MPSSHPTTPKLPYRTPVVTVYGDLSLITSRVGKTGKNADGAPGAGMPKTK